MDFYGRYSETDQLHKWDNMADESAQMTIVIGRRRIGKTTLIRTVFDSALYFFVAKKNESLLCDELIYNIRHTLNVDVTGEFKSFSDIFKYLLQLSKTMHITFVIDEFQEFYTINSAIYSEMQNLWDTYKHTSKMHLILCNSIYSFTTKIFENVQDPIFRRANNRITLKSLSPDVLKQILSDYSPKYTPADLLTLYMATGGVPRYIELLMEEKAFTTKRILAALLSENSFFLDEGKNVLIEEFGKDHTTYFSILSLIASSKTSRPEIEGAIGHSVGPQIEKLETEFMLIKRVTPMFSKPNTRQIRYKIEDNFLSFWFRFIYKYRSAIEIGNTEYVAEIIQRDYKPYVGRILEKYFLEKLTLSHRFSAIGTYWEHGNKNEIDIVAVNAEKKQLLIAEVKLNPKEFNLRELEAKAAKLLESHPDYTPEFTGFSIDDM